jgi:hypothetical protein
MITLLLHLLRVLPFLVGGHRQLALENLALRQQLAVYRRTVARPRLPRTDRLFWVGPAKVWTAWRSHLLIVTPNTVLILCPADEEMRRCSIRPLGRDGRKRWLVEVREAALHPA